MAGGTASDQRDQEQDELDPEENGDRLFVPEAGIHEFRSDLAQLLRVGGRNERPSLFAAAAILACTCS